MRLSGFEIRNFRSIGSDGVLLHPWKKCNILVGKNNSGKSNVIRAVELICSYFQTSRGNRFTLENSYLRQESNVMAFSVYSNADSKKDSDVISLLHDVEEVRFDYTWDHNSKGPSHAGNSLVDIDDSNIKHLLAQKATRYALSKPITQRDHQKLDEILVSESGNLIGILQAQLPQTFHIPEFRQITQIDGAEYDFNGQNLIKLLADYQHPPVGSDYQQKKFRRVEKLVQRLLHIPDAILEVSNPSTGDASGEIVITANTANAKKLRLPLQAYGTGVHELVILITAILSIENALVCIEEPEIHLHPTLQREFIEFITTETSNTYLISTHSPTLINAHESMPNEISEQIQVFHIRAEDGVTRGGPVLESAHSLLALADLGARASDLLQSNCVIWVEGPSDRIYINRWLELVDPELIEGLHYTIMFYGGSLLAHMTLRRKEDVPLDDPINEFVELLRVNQHSIVVMDDDREHPQHRKKAYQKRIAEECAETDVYSWITAGREIENYLPAQVVGRTCLEFYDATIAFKQDRWAKFDIQLDRALKKAKKKPLNYGARKAYFARKFAANFQEDDFKDNLDLRKQVEKIASLIRHWNK